ncbi:MAG: SprT-like domain-containing protein [Planctomycetota bacterium]|nr:SprT-like domain-containing protein [Planctomycetota bacterium]MDA0931973.1 SprT-like domain-containing protein [Planctomycetota bacterium]MDA1221690.1 SprT-like domain-containing protein [Planctomycetota bacterium]
MEHARELEWLVALHEWWGYYNDEYCRGQLQPVSIALSRGTTKELGSWDGRRRLIEISAAHIQTDAWQDVMSTMRHEMAHQFAEEVLVAHGEPPHGPAFRKACRILRVEARATASGPDAVAAAADDAAARLTRVVSKLLALGSSPNENEAAAAMRKARALMLEHNVGIVQEDRTRSFQHRGIGEIRKRHPAWEYTLTRVLTDFFFVRGIWAEDYDAESAKGGTRLFLYGTKANLEMAEYVHAFLSSLLPQLWRAHKRENALRTERPRLQFYDGVLHGFLRKLREQDRPADPRATALVWRGDPRLDEYYRWLNPRIRMRGGGTRTVTDAFFAGQEAGRSVTIHRPLQSGDGSSGPVRRLGAGD